jgi:hypothetical protein
MLETSSHALEQFQERALPILGFLVANSCQVGHYLVDTDPRRLI